MSAQITELENKIKTLEESVKGKDDELVKKEKMIVDVSGIFALIYNLMCSQTSTLEPYKAMSCSQDVDVFYQVSASMRLGLV